MPKLGDNQGSRQSFNDRARRACDFYVDGKSLYESLCLAGYSEQYAHKKGRDWLKNRQIVDYIHTRRIEMQQQDSYKKFDFLKFLRGKLDDPNIDEKARVEYAKLLSKVKGFDKEIELLEKKIDIELKALEVSKATEVTGSLSIVFKEAKKDD